MSRTVEISVTQEDIDAGEWREAERCPIALALRRCTGGRAYVDEDTIALGERWPHGPFAVALEAPPEVQAFVRRFDDCDPRRRPRPLSPFTFTLEIP